MPRTIAIIGSGPTAIYAARYLLQTPGTARITMFESQSEAGKGSPYHPKWTDPSMLANIASIEIPPVCESLTHWLTRQPEQLLARWGITPQCIDDRAFYPRVVLGEYFKSQLAYLAQSAPGALEIRPHHHVADIRVMAQGIELAVQTPAGLQYPVFSHVIIATGHNMPTQAEIRPGYFIAPWPTSALRTIGQVPVGIRGTSLSGIDAAIALATARGAFYRDENQQLNYLPEPGTENFHMTMMSRKGLLPEADFYHPIPYQPLKICTLSAIETLIERQPETLLDASFALFKAELAQCDPAYASHINLPSVTIESFAAAYFASRLQQEPFISAQANLEEAKQNEKNKIVVSWRYAILRMHEIIGRTVRHLNAEDHRRFHRLLKPVFVDNYATVPHLSIERLLALRRADKLQILRLGDNYQLDTQVPQGGAVLHHNGQHHFPAFVEAMGQQCISADKFPFPTLLNQGVVQAATAAEGSITLPGIELDEAFHPVSTILKASNIYCVSLPFLLAQFPFAQGITGSHEMGKVVAESLLQGQQIPAPQPTQQRESQWA